MPRANRFFCGVVKATRFPDGIGRVAVLLFFQGLEPQDRALWPL